MELPTRMQFRFREINKILKQTVYLVPNNGQSTVNAGDTIIVELPHNSVVDFTTFIMDYTGQTTDVVKMQMVLQIFDRLDFSLGILIRSLNN